MKTFQASSKKAGPRALLTAIVGQAAADLADGDRGAAAYFLSEQYKHHVSLLGFPADYLPVGVKAADLVALVEGPTVEAAATLQNDASRHSLAK